MPRNKSFSWSNQTILLTGGTGSFGQAFVNEFLKNALPEVIRIYSRDEFKQYEMQKLFPHRCIRYFIGDVRDKDRLKRAMDGVTIVIHAAAMKQIVASEYNPSETISTNIIGALNVVDTAIDSGVRQVIALGTDKAVVPINLYGATKLCAEKLFIQANSYSGGKTHFSCVRYGNVAASRGSVIPLFLEQKKTGTITITDKNMTRFWITLSEAVKLVRTATENMRGGEIFIPKMPSFNILDLAYCLAPRAKIKFIGIRPGEKTHEDLIITYEAQRTYEQKNFFVILPEFDFSSSRRIFKGKKLKKNFSYNSQTNPQKLTRQELASRIRYALSSAI